MYFNQQTLNLNIELFIFVAEGSCASGIINSLKVNKKSFSQAVRGAINAVADRLVILNISL